MFDWKQPADWTRAASAGGQAGSAQFQNLKDYYGKHAGVAGNFRRAGETGLDTLVNPAKHLLPASLARAIGTNSATGVLARSAGEALGIDYGFSKGISGYGTNYGFLGAKHFVNARSEIAKAGWKSAGGSIASGVGATLAGGLTIYDTVSMVSQGYTENGMTGAASGFATSMMHQYVGRNFLGPAMIGAAKGIWGGAKAGWAFGGALAGAEAGWLASGTMGLFMGAGGATVAALLNPVTLTIAAGAYGYNKAAEYIQHTDRAIARHKQVRGLELGGPIQDQFGTISTLRQRSLQALQNTHVNGRMAFGQEAALLHSSF